MTFPEATKLPRYFGKFGGMFVPEILMPALLQLEDQFINSINDQSFNDQLNDLLINFAGRPTPLTKCSNLPIPPQVNIFLKREDLLHGGAHKTNQVLGQALLAMRMNKKNIIAETGAGQHGVACALVCSLLKLKCRIYMGEKDIARQEQNVFRMKLLGAEVIKVSTGAGTLKDAVNEALRDWSASYDSSHYLLGTAAGPHPYPTIVKHFQKIIGQETKSQFKEMYHKLPDAVIAAVGGGSNAIGIFNEFIADNEVALYGIEPGGKGINTAHHGAALTVGIYGVLHGAYSAVMHDQQGQISESYSLSAGLDYPAVGPEHAYLQDIGRVKYLAINDDQAVSAFLLLSKNEGIIPALESSHAIAFALQLAAEYSNSNVEKNIIVNLSGRGDKDLGIVQEYLQKNNLSS